MSEDNHFSWIDDLIKRWPFFVFILGVLGWATNLQLQVGNNAKDLKEISTNWPAVIAKIDNLDKKFDALIRTMGYEVRYVALKTEDIDATKLIRPN